MKTTYESLCPVVIQCYGEIKLMNVFYDSCNPSSKNCIMKRKFKKLLVFPGEITCFMSHFI